MGDISVRLQRARQYIDVRCHEPLNVDILSTEAGYSPYHFIRLFRQAFHTTPHQYLTSRRIEHAKQLLASSDMPVTDVCLAVGFVSLGSFSSLFTRRVGYSPAVYRARQVQLRRVPHCFLWMSGRS